MSSLFGFSYSDLSFSNDLLIKAQTLSREYLKTLKPSQAFHILCNNNHWRYENIQYWNLQSSISRTFRIESRIRQKIFAKRILFIVRRWRESVVGGTPQGHTPLVIWWWLSCQESLCKGIHEILIFYLKTWPSIHRPGCCFLKQILW